MVFCEHCVGDREIASIIQSAGAKSVGCCQLCKTDNVCLYNTEAQSELTSYFEELIGIYSPANSAEGDVPAGVGKFLTDEMHSRWNLFPTLSNETVKDLLIAICPDLYENSPELFDSPVYIPELYDTSYLETWSLLKNNDWDSFVKEIKTKNRYHSKQVNFDVLEKYCSFIRKTYKAGTEFFRARISDERGYPPEKMSAPPEGKSAEGRANARGITCLYVADSLDTALHEVRAGIFDYVTVAKLVLKQDITIVDLSAISNISPFIDNLDYLSHAINRPHLERLNKEMSRPLRRSDSTLDYVPTQYIVDFIKSIEHNGQQEYDGIEYTSTATASLSRYNLAVFNPDLFACSSVTVYNIKDLQYVPQKVEHLEAEEGTE